MQVCFVAGTPVLLADGTSKPIEKILVAIFTPAVYSAYNTYSTTANTLAALYNIAVAAAENPDFIPAVYFIEDAENVHFQQIAFAGANKNDPVGAVGAMIRAAFAQNFDDDYTEYKSDYNGYWDIVEGRICDDHIVRLYYISGGIFGTDKPLLLGMVDSETGFVHLTNGKWTTVELLNKEAGGWTNFEEFINSRKHVYDMHPDKMLEGGGLVSKQNALATAINDPNVYKRVTPDDVNNIVGWTDAAYQHANSLVMYYAIAPLDLTMAVRPLASELSKVKRFSHNGVFVNPRDFYKTIEEARQGALSAAQLAASNANVLRRAGQWGEKFPAVSAGAVHWRTGQVFMNHSNVLNLPIHPVLRAAEPAASLIDKGRAVSNCAEYNIINQALHSGISRADLKDLIIVPVFTTNSGRIMRPCDNCLHIMRELGIPVF